MKTNLTKVGQSFEKWRIHNTTRWITIVTCLFLILGFRPDVMAQGDLYKIYKDQEAAGVATEITLPFYDAANIVRYEIVIDGASSANFSNDSKMLAGTPSLSGTSGSVDFTLKKPGGGALEPGVYSLTISMFDDLGACPASEDFEVHIMAVPVLNLSANTTVYCNYDDFLLQGVISNKTDLTTAGATSFTYEWTATTASTIAPTASKSEGNYPESGIADGKTVLGINNNTTTQVEIKYVVTAYATYSTGHKAVGKDSITIKVNPALDLSLPAAFTVCSGVTNNAAITLTTAITDGTQTYRWKRTDVTGVTPTADGNYNAYAAMEASFYQTLVNSGNDEATVTYTVEQKYEKDSKVCVSQTPPTVAVTIDPIPTLTLNTGTANVTEEICNATTATIVLGTTVTSSSTAVSYAITSPGNSDINSAATTNESVISGWTTPTLTNSSSDYADVVYTIVPKIGACVGTAKTWTVKVVPPINLTVSQNPIIVCSEDQMAELTISSTNSDAVKANMTLAWSLPFVTTELEVKNNGTKVNTSPATGSGNFSATGNKITVTNIKDPAAAVHATLTASATYSNTTGATCTAVTKNVAITVNPKPKFKLGTP
ncbi:hypothetical protein LJB94_02820 [Odoribacter sp. OttesenSCG-928-G04]|nr:hypothetical protein [Odoribacter sp. OttesenSCG-928-G04]MDL2331120.1 hypothetical protein [Odoribacter sp. OttesenSCG-928-A06]